MSLSEEKFRKKMVMGRRLGFSIESANFVFKSGFIGGYEWKMQKEIDDPALRSIADELIRLQATSRLLVGHFFRARTMFIGTNTMIVNVHYDKWGVVGQATKAELGESFRAVAYSFTKWLHQ